METTMDIDEMKSAWQTLDRHMQRQSALNLHIFLERKLDKVRSNMRRMYWGRIGQILFGDAMIYFGILSVMRYRDVPHLLACGALMLAYGLLTVVLGGITLKKISSVDYTAPVLEISKRVAALQRTYAIANLCLGLPWWFLWFAIFMLEVKANLDADLYLAAPAFIWANIGVGIVGTLASLWFCRRARDLKNPRLSKALENAGVPRSLRDAKSALDEISRFEQV